MPLVIRLILMKYFPPYTSILIYVTHEPRDDPNVQSYTLDELCASKNSSNNRKFEYVITWILEKTVIENEVESIDESRKEVTNKNMKNMWKKSVIKILLN